MNSDHGDKLTRNVCRRFVFSTLVALNSLGGGTIGIFKSRLLKA